MRFDFATSWRRLAGWAVVAALSAAGFASTGHASDRRGIVSLADAAKAFDDTALRVNSSAATEIARWTGPIYVAIADRGGLAGHAGEIEAAIRSMAAIARVPVERVSMDDPRRNIAVRATTGGNSGLPTCRSHINWNDAGQMVSVEVMVDLETPSRVTRCINHEVMHSFGFRAHPRGVVSVLSYSHTSQAALTELDRVLLETLYDARLQPNMSIATASVVGCGIIAEKIGASAGDVATVCANRGAKPAERVALSETRVTH
ncbi:MAG: DUF2927 domain-containing protein [Rhodospirillales bacterium]|nr:DUF2927 domain-containing protein [Rhodospirillales bacterium]